MQFIRDGIVFIENDKRLFGKLLDFDEDFAEVEFFHSIARKEIEQFPLFEVSRFALQNQTRVFVEKSIGDWRAGRVLSSLEDDTSAIQYSIRFPNRETSELLETDIYVRCLGEFADPSEILAEGGAETQGYADHRRRALKHIRNLRSACEGLTGLYSAAIDLIPYQVTTVRRVMQDPLQRYLLADEVGLGKTIEAGAIIRQVMLDDPDRSVVVLVPHSLVSQWQHELANRFYLNDEHLDLLVLPYEEASKIDFPPDLLVIDEAHRVVAAGSMAATPLVKQIEQLAHDVESLLLLSATPALGDEARLFGLLHLLNPVSYPKSDLAGFRRKVESRQEVGRLLLPMKPGGNAFVLKSQAKSAMAMFPDDEAVQEISQSIVDAGDDRTTMDQSTNHLRDHIARTYRIHDRLLRSRRADAGAWAMRPRAEPYPNVNHVRLVFDTSEWGTELLRQLESWRLSASAQENHSKRHYLIDRWRTLIDLAFQGRKSLLKYLNDVEPLFEEELEHLTVLKEHAQSDLEQDTRFVAVCRDLKEWHTKQPRPLPGKQPAKIVCFVTDVDDASSLSSTLRKAFGPFDISDICRISDREDRTAKVRAFENDKECWILIADRAAEEGLNLQFAHAIFHMDLPTYVSRLEQRIGRLDRFGRKAPAVQHRILLPNDDEDAPWYAWMNLLLNGFRIFSTSVSDVQFKLDELENDVWRRLFEEGTGVIEDLSECISETIADERRKLNEQHALDEIASLSESGAEIVERMEEAEEDERELEAAFHGWLSGVMRLSLMPPHPKPNETFKIFWDKPLLPTMPWQRVLEPSIDIPLTWRRTLAQNSRVSPRLLRPGSDLFAALDRLSSWDDRGIAYATWRVQPGIEEPLMVFRMVWVLSPLLSSEAAIWEPVERPDLHRRAEGYLPIQYFERWVDIEGEPVTDPHLLGIASAPYRTKPDNSGRYDINLGSQPDAFEEIVDPTIFAETIRGLRGRCEADIWDSEDVIVMLNKARQKFEREAAFTIRSLRQRQAYLRTEFDQELEGLEETLKDLEVLRHSIENPALRLDECGFLYITNEAPDAVRS